MTNRRPFLLLLAGFTLLTAQAFGTATCSISSSGAAFGSYNSIGGTNDNVVATITVTCTGNIGDPVNSSIALSQGGASSFYPRIMTAGSPQLDYNLYLDALHTTVWGDGTGGTSTVSDSYTLSSSPNQRQYNVYGVIGGGQNTDPAGSYTDTLVATLTY
jgi:spore coat protein U-like protein